MLKAWLWGQFRHSLLLGDEVTGILLHDYLPKVGKYSPACYVQVFNFLLVIDLAVPAFHTFLDLALRKFIFLKFINSCSIVFSRFTVIYSVLSQIHPWMDVNFHEKPPVA